MTLPFRSLSRCDRGAVPIALTVVHPSPSFVRGLAASFDADRFLLVGSDELDRHGNRLVMFAATEGADWEHLEVLCGEGAAMVVALIPTLDVAC